MIFTATLLRTSRIHTLWTQHHRVGGLVEGVHFRWTPDGTYVSDNLTGEQIDRMKSCSDVRLETMTDSSDTVFAPTTIQTANLSGPDIQPSVVQPTTPAPLPDPPPMPVPEEAKVAASENVAAQQPATPSVVQNTHEQEQHRRRGRPPNNKGGYR